MRSSCSIFMRYVCLLHISQFDKGCWPVRYIKNPNPSCPTLALTKAVMSAPHLALTWQSAKRISKIRRPIRKLQTIGLRSSAVFRAVFRTANTFTLVRESEERCLRFLESLGISLSEFRGLDGHTAFEDLKCTEVSSCLWRSYALKFAEVDMRTNLTVLLGIKMLICRPDFQCPQQHFELRSTSISNHISKHADIGLTEF